MNTFRLLAALLTTSATLAHAAPTPYTTIDHSSAALMDPVTAQAMWKDQLPAKLNRLYPGSKWGFVSEVEGGFGDSKTCVVTARAMLLPRVGKNLVFRPAKTATAYGWQADATAQQCREFAKQKLGEAMGAVRSALLAE